MVEHLIVKYHRDILTESIIFSFQNERYRMSQKIHKN